MIESIKSCVNYKKTGVIYRDRQASQVALAVKNPPANAGDIRDADWIPGPGGETPLEEGMATLQHSCLENPMGRGSWCAMGCK